MRFQFITVTFLLPLAIAMCGKAGFDGVEAAANRPTEQEIRRQVVAEAERAYKLNPSFYDTILRWGREDDERAEAPSVINADEYFHAASLEVGSSFKARASYYADDFHGRPRADGKKFDMYAIGCASKTLPLGAVIDVYNPATKRAVRCPVNDRGPYMEGRDLDLSLAAAMEIGSKSAGVVTVIVRVVSLPSGRG